MGGETAELYTDDHRNIFILTAASFVSRLDVLQQQRPALMLPFLIVGWPILVAFAALLLSTQQPSSEMSGPSISAEKKKEKPAKRELLAVTYRVVCITFVTARV
jgi:hypothetical protein